MLRKLPLLLVLLMVVFLGCSSTGGDGSSSGTAVAGGENPDGSFTGKVVETMDAGGYTYARLEGGGRTLWAAGPPTALQVGETRTISMAMMMQDFHSETLQRDFPEIYFVGMFGEAEGVGTASGEGMAAGHGRPPVPDTDIDLRGIERADGGLTIEELYARRADLAGQQVTVRGKVVKFLGGIMDRNWIHLQDGTGTADAGTHDLTLTTDQTAAVGDLITVTGMVAVDKDFGAGYRYPLLVEGASVQKN